jgi:hypothetical protein
MAPGVDPGIGESRQVRAPRVWSLTGDVVAAGRALHSILGPIGPSARVRAPGRASDAATLTRGRRNAPTRRLAER